MSNFDKMSIIKKSKQTKKEHSSKPKIDLEFDQKSSCANGDCSCCVKINMFDPNFQKEWQSFVEKSMSISTDEEIITKQPDEENLK